MDYSNTNADVDVYDKVFIAWRKVSRRTANLARELGLAVKLFSDRPPYFKAYRETKRFLDSVRPRIVFVQLPQGPLLYVAAKMKEKLGYTLVADVHTAFIVYDGWKGWVLNWPFKKYLDKVDLVLVHNEPMLNLLSTQLRERAMVLYDPMPYSGAGIETSFGDYFVFPASWHEDEPIEFILDEYIKSGTSYKIIITGRPKNKKVVRKYSANSKVVFSGYLPDRQYLDLLAKARCIIAATTREYTMLSAAWEALALNKPLAVSKTKTLYEILGSGPEYFTVGVHGSLARIFGKLHDETYVSDLARRISILKQSLQEKTSIQFRRLKELLESIS